VDAIRRVEIYNFLDGLKHGRLNVTSNFCSEIVDAFNLMYLRLLIINTMNNNQIIG
jgi:hypothetical protein